MFSTFYMKSQQTNEEEFFNSFPNILTDDRKSSTKAFSRKITYIIRQHGVTAPIDFSSEVTHHGIITN